MAKRLLPFTASQHLSQLHSTQIQQTVDAKQAKKSVFQPRIPSTITVPVIPDVKAVPLNPVNSMISSTINEKNDSSNLKLLIEKKRQEALMKLRRRQPK